MEQDIVLLVVGLKEKKAEAFNLVFEEYKNDVYYFALSHVKNEQAAEDIVQETFIEMMKSIKNLEKPEAFKSWLIKIAYFCCTKKFRKDKKSEILLDEDSAGVFETIEEETDEFLPEEALVNDETRAAIAKMVTELPDEQKAAILLHYYEQLGVRDIASVMECSEGTVKSRLNYGRKTIKKRVEELMKKGVVMFSVVPLPILTRILLEEASKNTLSSDAAQTILNEIIAQTGLIAGTASAGGAVSAAVTPGVSVTSAITTKIIIGVVSVGIIGAGVATVILNNKQPVSPVAIVETPRPVIPTPKPSSEPEPTPKPSPEPTEAPKPATPSPTPLRTQTPAQAAAQSVSETPKPQPEQTVAPDPAPQTGLTPDEIKTINDQIDVAVNFINSKKEQLAILKERYANDPDNESLAGSIKNIENDIAQMEAKLAQLRKKLGR